MCWRWDKKKPDGNIKPIPPGELGGGGAFDAHANFEQLAISDNLR